MEPLPATTREHRAFFRQKGWIAFEDAISEARRVELLGPLRHTVEHRLSQTLERSSPLQVYTAGSDLWRDTPILRAAAGNFGWAKLVAELLEARSLRLIGDQLWLWRTHSGPWKAEQVPFVSCGMPWLSLDQIVSCEGVTACLFFNLEGPEDGFVHDQMPLSPFGAPGSVVIVRSDLPLNLSFFQGKAKTTYCVLVGERQARYQPAPYDPQPQRLKSQGYRVGQQLMDKLHPLLWTS